MSYKRVFVTKKLYNDGTEKIFVKNGYRPNAQKIRLTKFKNKILKENNYIKLLKQGQLSFTDLSEYNQKLEEFNRKYAPKLENAIRSMNRAKNNLMDILKSNDFDFFVTLTFDKNLINRLDDKETRKAFAKFVKDLHRNFNNMIYVAVPEYHKKGGLHFHLLIGGATAEDLGLEDSGKRVKSGRCKGQTIFNVTKWQIGFSTATKILDTNAVKYYLSKYLTKGKVDPRFFNKKRFYVSQNIKRPQVQKEEYIKTNNFNIFNVYNKNEFKVDYEDIKKEYCVLSRQIKE